MMAERQIVSYDDLYSDDEAQPEASAAPAVGAKEDQQQESAASCTSESEAESNGGDADIGGVLARSNTWDDSELIRAWDSTIGEYRKQHAAMLNDSEQRAEFHKSESKVGEWAPAGESNRDGGQPRKKRRREAEISPPQAPASEEEALYMLNMSWYYTGYYACCYQVSTSKSRYFLLVY
ncbi:hypothetical protein GGI12_002805 [Dipsacomyces acuminosporus]|nr:hypothetical protein GGI12_002805 [Dipsacomyces acuminosporus]